MYKDIEACRKECRRLKWEEGIAYKVMAEDWLKMNYNTFINFVHGQASISDEKIRTLNKHFDNE